MGQATLQSRDGVQSLVKGFVVLETVVTLGGHASLTELVSSCDLPAATVHRLVRTLVDIGYLRQDASRGYTLGSRILFLADLAPSVLDRVAMPDLRGLAKEFGETFSLGRIDADAVLYSAEAPSARTVRHIVEVGARGPAYATAMGKAILATWPPDRLEAWLDRVTLAKLTPNTIIDRKRFLAELETVRVTGVAFDNEEHELAVSAIAIAVPQTTVRTAIMMSGPSQRMTDDLIERALVSMQEVAGVLRKEFCRPEPGAAEQLDEPLLAAR